MRLRGRIGVLGVLLALGAAAYDANLAWKYDSARPADVTSAQESSALSGEFEARFLGRGQSPARADLEARFRMLAVSDGADLDARTPKGFFFILR